jgi:hypothetical protein
MARDAVRRVLREAEERERGRDNERGLPGEEREPARMRSAVENELLVVAVATVAATHAGRR